ncbi:S8 family peptidase [Planctomonas psychrotolerans]|uniref:S8 family peptidase n=1 Tax=Planctomonas psychrotolerans TaxID=2528712 RepID=UPI001238CB22|nr:S8 family serine peptidase [Planctomonas psychrotolerans]
MRARLRIWAAVVVTALATVLIPSAAAADPVRDRQYWLDAYGFRSAWEVTRGEGVTVAVIDTGVVGSVPELAGVVRGGVDVSGIGSLNGQTPVGQSSGHGTLVASLIAGRGTGDGSGVLGVAPEASILSVSVALGAGARDSDDQIAAAVRWAVDNGADVINMSLTRNSLDWPESWDDAFLHAAENDVVIVAAAGNRGSGTAEVGAPATIPGVVAVAGVDRDGRASFDASSQGITIAVAAPSEELVGVMPDGSYVQWSGTSGAAPLVSGLVALIRASHPELDADNVVNRLVRTATPAGTSTPDSIYGYGLINAAAAVRAPVEQVTGNPVGDLSLAEWVRLYRRADAPPVPQATSVPPPRVEQAPPAPYDPATAVPPGVLDLLPSALELRTFGVPALFFAGFGAVLALLLVAAVRHFRRVLRK